MRITLSLLLVCAAGFAQTLSLDPASISNAASQIPPGYPNGGVSHGGMFIVKAAPGSGALGACGVKIADRFPIQTNLNSTSMKITAGNSSYDVPMIYVVACSGTDQLAGIVPSATPTGKGTLTVTYNGQSASAPITIVDSTPGFFTINQGGTGPVIVQNFNSAADLPVNTLASSAKPGQIGVLWGTGLGPDGHSDADAPQPTDIPVDFELYVGGKRAAVSYKGRSGCCAGVDQIVFQVPDGVTGCFVPVVAKIGTAVSNFTTMSIAASGGACSDASFLTAADVQAAQGNNKIRIAAIDLVRADQERVTPSNTGTVTREDTAAAAFADLTYVQLLGLPVREVSTPGSCTVWRGGSDTVLGRPPLLGPYVNLDAGTLTIAGASTSAGMGYRGAFYRAALGTASYREPAGGPGPSRSFLEPGNFAVSSQGGGPVPGGRLMGPFQAQITVPAPPRMENRFTLGDVQRAQGVTVTWSGADANSLVSVRGVSAPADPATPPVSFFCVEKASASQFTIPPAVLLSLPPSSSDSIGLSVGTVNAARFSAPGIDAAFVRATALFGRSVAFR